MDAKHYQYLAKSMEPKKPVLANTLRAFLIGGGICLVGQVVASFFLGHGFDQEKVTAPTSIAMVFLGALFTALGLYDRLAKFAGMGTALPITGFSNSMVAPAMEFKREGPVLGVGARMFQVAGPVLAYGLLTAFVVGIYTTIRLAMGS